MTNAYLDGMELELTAHRLLYDDYAAMTGTLIVNTKSAVMPHPSLPSLLALSMGAVYLLAMMLIQ